MAQHDAAGDFWYDTRPDSKPVRAQRDSGAQSDILRTRYSHSADTVRVRLELADLGRFSYWLFDVRIKTDEGMHRRLELFRDYDGGGRAAVRWSGARPCDIAYRLDLSQDVVTAAVPRSCLGRPRTVAFKVATNYWATSDDYPYRDIAGSTGYDFNGWSQGVPRG